MSTALSIIGAVAVLATATSCAEARGPSQRVLQTSWHAWLREYVQDDGRVIDRAAGGISTSEGQAYVMTRAVWAGDRETFDKARRWTLDNLQGGDAMALPAWKWGSRADGSWGVIDPQPAADADIWMAWSLVLAHRAWGEPQYLQQSLGMIRHLWDTETVDVGGHRVLLPGPWARGLSPVPVNPSYYLPFAFRDFAALDPYHPWGELVTESYRVLDATVDAYALPPDWCYLDAQTGALVAPPPGEEYRLSFGYEAMRVPWTLAADVMWHDAPEARVLLARLDVLAQRWKREDMLPAIIGTDGAARVTYESRGLYGALLPAWALTRSEEVQALYERATAPQSEASSQDSGMEYYAENWVWFGLALWTGKANPLEKP